MSKLKLVHGVGINDVDYQISVKAIVDGKRKQLWRCPFHQSWASMLMRCYNAQYQSKQPTYIGCTVVNEWHRLSTYREWMISQPWEGFQLDKDILYPNNRVYSPEFCVFVPQSLNSFLIDGAARRGEWPIGVSLCKSNGKFQVHCRDPFSKEREFLGFFTDPLAGHEAWRKRKHELACVYADQQTDPRIAEALRIRYST